MVREASLVDRRQLKVFEPSSLPGLSQTLDFATFAPEIAQLNNSHVLYHVALESVTKGCGKLQPPATQARVRQSSLSLTVLLLKICS